MDQNKNITRATSRLESQNQRIDDYETMCSNLRKVNEQIGALEIDNEPLDQDSELVLKRRILMTKISSMDWKSDEKEEKRMRDLKKDLEECKAVMEKDNAIVAKTMQWVSDRVDLVIVNEISKELDNLPNKPGEAVRKMIEVLKSEVEGDQIEVQKNLKSSISDTKTAVDDNDAKRKLESLREMVQKYKMSSDLMGVGGALDMTVVSDAVETILRGKGVSFELKMIQTINKSKDFESLSRLLLTEIDRLGHLDARQGLKKEQNSDESYRSDEQSSTVAMSANYNTNNFGSGSNSSSKICYQYQNGKCSRGDNSRFQHTMMQSGQQQQKQYLQQQALSYYQQLDQRRGDERGGGSFGNRGREEVRREDRGRDRDRSREKGPEDKSYRDRGRDSLQDRGGGSRDRVQDGERGGTPPRQDTRGGGGRGDRGGERSRSGSPYSSRSRDSYGSTPHQSPEKPRPATPLRPRDERDKSKGERR